MSRRGAAALTASPVLVGAVTLLVTIVAVFLSYNANSGLPFVPTYNLKVTLPDAANLVAGNDVRIGGARVGVVSNIKPVANSSGPATAQIEIKLDKDQEPLPVDSTIIVRPRSALGLKYVQVTPGTAKQGYPAGSTVPVAQSKPAPVEFDQVLNMFNDRARRGSQENLNGFGTGLAGRGASLNSAIAALPPLLGDLEPVTQNLANPSTQLARFFKGLQGTASEVAPVAEEQAAVFVNLDTTFTALAGVARPFLQQFISESPPTEDVAIKNFPLQRPFLRNNAAFFRELRPGIHTLPASAPVLADAFETGVRVLPKTPKLNNDLASLFNALADFSDNPLVARGISRLTKTADSLKPTLAFLTPVQSTCNYATLFFRNVASLVSEGDKNGTWQRFNIIISPHGANAESGPSSAPANGPLAPGLNGGSEGGADINHLHVTPYPYTASPGQPRECEAGNENYVAGRTVIGHAPGNPGTKTEGQGSRPAKPDLAQYLGP
jgi:virulence factor Mce-like protein